MFSLLLITGSIGQAAAVVAPQTACHPEVDAYINSSDLRDIAHQSDRHEYVVDVLEIIFHWLCWDPTWKRASPSGLASSSWD